MPTNPEQPEPELTLHIFTVAAAMVGVCLTGIGLFRAFGGHTSAARLGDDLLAMDATMFAIASVFAFSSFRIRSDRHRRRLRLMADWLFFAGLALMVAVCLVLTYAMV